VDENKENISPESPTVTKVTTPKNTTKASTTAVSTAAKEENEISDTTKADSGETKPKKNKRNDKKKPRDPLSEVKLGTNQQPHNNLTELKQGEYTIDYQGLHDALRDTFNLDDRVGEIHFAPLASKTKKFEKSTPVFSRSSSSVHGGAESRNSNKSAPTAKSKYY
jgi:hypothetical protein